MDGIRWGVLCAHTHTHTNTAILRRRRLCTRAPTCIYTYIGLAPRYWGIHIQGRLCAVYVRPLLCTSRIIAGVCHGYECPVESCNAASIHLRARKLRETSLAWPTNAQPRRRRSQWLGCCQKETKIRMRNLIPSPRFCAEKHTKRS